MQLKLIENRVALIAETHEDAIKLVGILETKNRPTPSKTRKPRATKICPECGEHFKNLGAHNKKHPEPVV